jgi:HSP20 family molecular chaperone IbpA
MRLVPRRDSFDLLDNFFGNDDFFTRRNQGLMKTDIRETDTKFIIEVDLPGYSKENIDLSLNDGYLEITAKVEKEDNSDANEKYVCKERYYGECSRSFYVGEEIEAEDVKASFKNGILTLDIPKKEEDKKLPEKKYVEIDD